MSAPILYLSSTLPTLSETFVYREVFALRERGVDVRVASVHQPKGELRDARLEELAREVIAIYGAGPLALARDALAEALRRPLRSVATLGCALRDALLGRDLTVARRVKVCVQSVAALALARRARASAIGHIHAHMAHVPTTIAMYAAKQLGISFSFTGHANDIFQQRTLLREKLRRAAFVACISHWHRAFYREIEPALREERAPVVRCGVDVPTHPAAGETESADETGPAEAPPRVFAVGRLVPKKGFDVLLRALGQLRQRGVSFSCALIGDGPQRSNLETLLNEHNLHENVALRGAQPHAEILAALRSADVFVLPCQPDSAGDRDGIPVALMEALAVGVPVISGDLPAIRELVRPDETGVLVPPGDVASLARALENLLLDADQRARLGAAGREWVRAEFSTDVNTERIIAAFRAVGAIDQRSNPNTPETALQAALGDAQ